MGNVVPEIRSHLITEESLDFVGQVLSESSLSLRNVY